MKRMMLVMFAFTVTIVAAGSGFPSGGENRRGTYTGPVDLIGMTIYLLIALGVSFLCSVLEAALLSVGPGQVQLMVESGRKSGRILEKLRSNLDRSLSAILTLNTVAHTAGAAGVGAEVARVFGDVYLGLASMILTLLVLILSEIIPKTLGARYSRALAGPSAILIHWLSILLLPIVIILQGITKLLFGKDEESVYSRMELIAIAGLAGKQGSLEELEAGMVQNMLRLTSLKVYDIMTPMTVLFSLAEEMTVKAAFESHVPIDFSRIPLQDAKGNLSRYLLYTDLLEAYQAEKRDQKLRDLSYPLPVVSDATTVYAALNSATVSRNQILLVANHFGQGLGIVTAEDILEAIAGRAIADENDEHASPRDFALRQNNLDNEASTGTDDDSGD